MKTKNWKIMHKKHVKSVVACLVALAGSAVFGTPVWTTSAWSGTQDCSAEASILTASGVTVSVDQVAPAVIYTCGDKLHDDIISDNGNYNFGTPAIYTVSPGAVITFSLPEAKDIRQLDLYTFWWDGGRDGVEVTKVETSADGATFTDVVVGSVSAGLNDNGSGGKQHLWLADSEAGTIATNVKVLRITLGSVDNGYIGLVEVRALQYHHDADLKWSVSNWRGNKTFRKEMNVLAAEGVNVSVVQGTPSDGAQYNSNAAVMVDNIVKDDGTYNFGTPGLYVLANQATLTFTLPEPKDIQGLEVYTYWGDGGRDGVNIAAVQVSSDGETYTALDTGTVSVGMNDNSSPGKYLLSLANYGGSAIATGVRYLRIVFGDTDNNGAGVVEVRALRAYTDELHTVTFYDRDGAVLDIVEVKDGSAATAPAAPDIPGCAFTGWDADISLVLGDLSVHPVYEIDGTLTWSASAWSGTQDFLASSVSVLTEAGVSISVSQGTPGDGANCNDASVMSDEIAHDDFSYNYNTPAMFVVASGSVITYTLPYARDIQKLDIYSHWADGGRDGLTISSVETSKDGVSFTSLPVNSYSAGISDSSFSGKIDFTLKNVSGTAIANQIKAIRINLGAVENNGVGIVEIRAVRYVHAVSAWTVETWDGDIDRTSLAKSNLLSQAMAKTVVVSNPASTVAGTETVTTEEALAKITDGKVVPTANGGEIYALGSGAVLEYDFNASKNVYELDFWSYWPDGGRDGIAVRSIWVKKAPSCGFVMVDTVPEFAYGTLSTGGGNSSYGRLHARLSRGDGKPLFEYVTAVRVGFGVMDNGWTGIQEVEAFGKGNGLVLRLK